MKNGLLRIWHSFTCNELLEAAKKDLEDSSQWRAEEMRALIKQAKLNVAREEEALKKFEAASASLLGSRNDDDSDHRSS